MGRRLAHGCSMGLSPPTPTTISVVCRARPNIYTYDANSNLKTLADSGGTVTYGYDQINRQSSVQEPGAASAMTYTYADHELSV
jgi:uncharacterized protein RhaS with RHS repeats